MSPATSEPAPGILSTHATLDTLHPTLEQLREWTSIPDQRVLIRDVDWAFYEQLVDSIPEGANLHVDFDGKDLEIMSLSPFHDGEKKRLVSSWRRSRRNWRSPTRAFGQTTWKRPEVGRGLEADECYYFQPEKIARSDRCQDAAIQERRRLSQS